MRRRLRRGRRSCRLVCDMKVGDMIEITFVSWDPKHVL